MKYHCFQFQNRHNLKKELEELNEDVNTTSIILVLTPLTLLEGFRSRLRTIKTANMFKTRFYEYLTYYYIWLVFVLGYFFCFNEIKEVKKICPFVYF